MFLITQFLLITANFTLQLFVGLVCFAVAWLYYDAWSGRHDQRESTKAIGFLLLSLSFVIGAIAIEQSLLETSIININTVFALTAFFRITGYLVLIYGQITDPLQPLPGYRIKAVAPAAITIAGIPLLDLVTYLFPILAMITAYWYLRRATLGLEHHLKIIAKSFYFLSLSEVLGLAATFRGTDNIAIANFVRPFGPVWLAQRGFLIIFALILGHWVWGYLIKRLETQLLMIFTSMILIIFLFTAIFYTTTSLNSLYVNTLRSPETNVQVLNYSIQAKKSQALSDAELIAQNTAIISAVNENDKASLIDLTTSMLLTKKQSFLTVVSKNGEVLVRADDPEKASGSLSDNPLIKKTLEGDGAASIVTTDAVMSPEVSVRAAYPIKTGDGVIGAVMIGTSIDSAFVDGLKEATGLDASIYADNVRSATTFVAPDGKSRWIGIREETEKVKKTVLVDGELFTGSVNILNVPYFAAYLPLKDISENTIGMLFVGAPQVSLLQAASQSIELTFLVTVALLVASIFSAYFVSRYIIDQIK